jgi:NAD+ diphosphatase
MNNTPFFSPRSLVRSCSGPDYSVDPRNRYVIVRGTGVIVPEAPQGSVILPHTSLPDGMRPERTAFMGTLDGSPCFAAEVPADFPVPAGHRFSGVRELYGTIPDDELAIAAYAVRIIDFDRTTRFCGRCGHKTRQLRTERAKLCTDCNLIVYPRISPAIIVLIKKGEQVLLAGSPRFPAGLRSVIAGFVEAGENLEEAVHREVQEEVGISVTNLRYFGSEPWPVPDSLMVGFVADYAGGEITIDNNEIIAAGWFDRDHLPVLPSMMSISRALIEAWIRQEI